MGKIIGATNRIVDGFCDHTSMVANDVLTHYNELLNNSEAVIYGRNTDNLCGYLMKITDDVVIDYYRSKDRPSLGINDIATHFDETAENKDSREYSLANGGMIAFIDKLPEIYKEALILTEINGESQKGG